MNSSSIAEREHVSTLSIPPLTSEEQPMRLLSVMLGHLYLLHLNVHKSERGRRTHQFIYFIIKISR